MTLSNIVNDLLKKGAAILKAAKQKDAKAEPLALRILRATRYIDVAIAAFPENWRHS